VLALAAVSVGLACSGSTTPAPPLPESEAQGEAATCPLAAVDALWIQEALDLWSFASGRLLLLPERPLAWMIFFDERCAFHLQPDRRADAAVASEPVATLLFGARSAPVFARPHAGGLVLPDGERRPLAPMAFASTYQRGNEHAGYFALALMSLWAQHPKVREGASVSERILTVAIHELAHTQQLLPLRDAIDALPAAPSSLSDDVVEQAFRGNAAYEAAFRAELDLLFRAADSGDTSECRRLANSALTGMRARHARFFVGEHAILAELEPLFLHLEGVGEWLRLRLVEESRQFPQRPELRRADPLFDGYAELRRMGRAEALAFVRGEDNDWVQDHGLALFLVIDRLAPGWQKAAFAGNLVSPYALLERGSR
jgi:hypothetical protein